MGAQFIYEWWPVVQPKWIKGALPLLAKSLKNFNPKLQVFKRVLDLTCK